MARNVVSHHICALLSLMWQTAVSARLVKDGVESRTDPERVPGSIMGAQAASADCPAARFRPAPCARGNASSIGHEKFIGRSNAWVQRGIPGPRRAHIRRRALHLDHAAKQQE